MTEPILRMRGVTQVFASRARNGWRRSFNHALDGVDLDVHEGETLAIVGESGSGKSTLAKLLLLLNKPTSGEVSYKGTSLGRLDGAQRSAYRRNVQAVFQDPSASLNPRMQVAETLGHVIRRHDLASPPEQQAFIEHHLAAVGLNPPAQFSTRYPSQLSGGQQQRIAIARAMMLEPRIVVADEPLSGLDISIQGQVLELMRELKRKTNVGFVIISHDLNAMESIADRVVVMHRGRIVEMGRDVFSNPRHEYTRLLLRARLPADPLQARAQLLASASQREAL
ncbi:ABC transporter ATP-binding protein [Variovorax sp. GT1P44]|uniref:ABC transporter ATP-binding protein n=1 Tax=Variovorax sp. GT1P44 TaxID=3443742 RepID=UPI003F458E80